jgi:hypothetical protein
MRFDIGPDGLTIVSFLNSHSIPWKHVAAIEMVDPARCYRAWHSAIESEFVDMTGDRGQTGNGVRVRKAHLNPICCRRSSRT